MNRRQLVKTWVLAFLASFGGRALSKTAANQNLEEHRDEFAALAPFVDTLLPDYLGPSGSQVGVPARLLARAAEDENFRHLLRAGCGWLDRQAQRIGTDHFADLSNDEQIDIVRVADTAAASSLERQFFERVRHDAFHHYYANAASWRYITHRGPPQPFGYPDYSSPPQ